jgi:hypothetical protein
MEDLKHKTIILLAWVSQKHTYGIDHTPKQLKTSIMKENYKVDNLANFEFGLECLNKDQNLGKWNLKGLKIQFQPLKTEAETTK